MSRYEYFKGQIDIKFIKMQSCIEKNELMRDYRNICMGEIDDTMLFLMVDLNYRLLKTLAIQQTSKGL